MFSLSVPLWVIWGSSACSYSLFSKPLFQFCAHKRRASIRMNIWQHSKDWKQLRQTSCNSDCISGLTWENKWKSGIFINYCKHINVLCSRWKRTLKINIQPFKRFCSFHHMGIYRFIKSWPTLLANSTLFYHITNIFNRERKISASNKCHHSRYSWVT